MTAGGAPRGGDRAWAAYPVAAFLGVGCYFLLPQSGDGEVLRVALYCLVSASAGFAVLAGVRRYRPEPRLPWLLLAASQLVYAAADTAFYVSHDLLEMATFPAPSDALHLARYPLLVAGLLLLVRLRAPGSG